MRRFLALFLLLAAPVAAGDKLYDYRELTLDNGLTVITLEDFSSPIVAVQVWYHVGSKNEDPERQGFAHMFEHMMFRGTERVANKEFDRLIKRVGGNSNAYTTFDNTTYICELPANQLELILWLEAERMLYLKVDEEGFHTERKVVEEERRQRNLNQPYGTIAEEIAAAVYEKHPYRWMPIGKIPHLRRATIEELESFWGRYYVPANAVLVIAGAVKHEEAARLVKKHFGWIPKLPAPPRVKEREPAQDGPRALEIQERKGPVPIGILVYRTVPQGHPDATALSLCLSILGGGASSRLYQDLVKERKLIQQPITISFSLEQDGVIGLGAVLSPMGGDVDKALAAIEEHVQKVREEGVTERELEKIKNQALRGAVTSTLTVAGKASALGSAATLRGDADWVNRSLDEIRAITAADVQRVAKTYLVDKNKTTVRVRPAGMLGALFGGGDKPSPEETEVPPPPEPETNRVAPRTGSKAEVARPDALPEEPPSRPPFRELPEIHFQEKKLANGLRVVVVPHHEVPFVSLSLAFPYGSFAESKPGVASLAAGQLTAGTASRSAKELAEELEFHAISLGASASADAMGLNASCLVEKLPKTLGYLAEVLETPAFPQEELDIAKQQLVTGLTMNARDPGEVVSKVLDERLYGDHPYGRRESGEIEDVGKITREDLAHFWKTYARPDVATLYVAGDVKAEDVYALVEEHLGEWKAEGELPQVALPGFPSVRKTHIVLVDMPGAAQSEIRAAHRSINRDHPDWHPSRVLSSIFGGGGFSSRLNDSLRVQKGLTYGAWGTLAANRFSGSLLIGTSTKTERTAEAVQAILDVIDDVRENAPTQDEVDTAAAALVGGWAGRWETPAAIASDLWFLELHGLPADYYEKAVKSYVEVTPEDCVRMAKDLLDPTRLAIVVVGDASKVKEGLEAIAPVEVVKP